MYRGFNLSLQNSSCLNIEEKNKEKYFDDYTEIDYYTDLVMDRFLGFLDSSITISAVELEEEWFPEIRADIFICHSHKDKNLAISLSNWLQENFGLSAFVDSSVWGCSDELLKSIDDCYCRTSDGYYDYLTRNSSTSHVHMLLATALYKMINKTECLMFLNTPNSITPDNIISQTAETLSPWIFYETLAAKHINKVKPSRLEERCICKRGIPISYNMNITDLYRINRDTLNRWKSNYNNNLNPLDVLYELCPVN